MLISLSGAWPCIERRGGRMPVAMEWSATAGGVKANAQAARANKLFKLDRPLVDGWITLIAGSDDKLLPVSSLLIHLQRSPNV
jgi:hypothetical protein